jgi:lipopolysaccharide export system protein LptA
MHNHRALLFARMSAVRPHQFKRLCACALLGAAFGGTPPAQAERDDREKPVNIEADRMTVDDLKKESVFEGNVTLSQGTLMLRADRVVVKQDAAGFNFAYAYGKPAHFRQRREGVDEYVEGFAERMEYDGKQDKLQMFTNAQVKKGLDEVRGDYISYDAVTEFYQVVGGGKQAGTGTNPQGRVRAVIQPKKRDKPPAAPGAAAEAAPAAENVKKPAQ